MWPEKILMDKTEWGKCRGLQTSVILPQGRKALLSRPILLSRTALWSPCILIWFRGRRTSVGDLCLISHHVWLKKPGRSLGMTPLHCLNFSTHLEDWVSGSILWGRHHSVAIRVDPGNVLSRDCAGCLPGCFLWEPQSHLQEGFYFEFSWKEVLHRTSKSKARHYHVTKTSSMRIKNPCGQHMFRAALERGRILAQISLPPFQRG